MSLKGEKRQNSEWINGVGVSNQIYGEINMRLRTHPYRS